MTGALVYRDVWWEHDAAGLRDPDLAELEEVLGQSRSGEESNTCSMKAYALPMSTLVAPPGWPRQVRPPDAPDWERTAVNWLFDICPPEYREHQALRRHVVVLARFAVLHVEASQAACRRGLSEARAELRDVANPRRRRGGRAGVAERGRPPAEGAPRGRTGRAGAARQALRGPPLGVLSPS